MFPLLSSRLSTVRTEHISTYGATGKIIWNEQFSVSYDFHEMKKNIHFYVLLC